MRYVIYPYLNEPFWVFDDERTGLKAEPFVSGASEAISALVEAKGISNAASGFSLTFGDEPFDGFDAELSWVRADDATNAMSGNWYRGEIGGQVMEGWLCPALLLYCSSAPGRLFIKADPLPAGVEPIWHVDPDDPRPRRFVSG
jgi:hypothetical protein